MIDYLLSFPDEATAQADPVVGKRIRRGLFALALMLAPLTAHAEIFDHLVSCDTELTCQQDAVIGKYYTPPSSDGPGGWRGDVVAANVSVYQVTGTQQVTDPQTGQTYTQDIRLPYPGWFAIIALPAVDPALAASSGTVLIADRDKASAGDPNFLVQISSGAQAAMQTAHVEPLFSGANYPFGGAPP